MTTDPQTNASNTAESPGVFSSVSNVLPLLPACSTEASVDAFSQSKTSSTERQVGRPELEESTSHDDSRKLEADAFHSLVFDLNAKFISQWQRVTDATGQEEIRCIVQPSELCEELEGKTRLLVQDTIRQRRVLSRLYVRGGRYFIVAAPLPEFPDHALCAVFSMDGDASDGVSKEARTELQHKCSEVALAAATCSIAKLRQVRLKQQIETQKTAPSEAHKSADLLASAGSNLAADAPTWTVLWHAAGKRLLASVAGIGRSSRRIAVVAMLILAVAFIPFPFSVVANVTCEPAERRYVAAPFDAKLLESKVRVGEEVVEGQLLAVLDGRYLASEVAMKQAELAQATQRRMAALTTGDASTAEQERLEVELLTNETKILEQRQQRLEIRSPLTGIVVAGDLERAAGSSLELGKELFEIAPLERIVAELAISEADISHIETGKLARISLDAWGGKSHRAQLTRLHPRSELREGESVFVAEADITDSPYSMRPGMHGRARISSGWKPLGWVLLHRPYEACRRWIGW